MTSKTPRSAKAPSGAFAGWPACRWELVDRQGGKRFCNHFFPFKSFMKRGCISVFLYCFKAMIESQKKASLLGPLPGAWTSQPGQSVLWRCCGRWSESRSWSCGDPQQMQMGGIRTSELFGSRCRFVAVLGSRTFIGIAGKWRLATKTAVWVN